jgi:hypothetical protein
LRAKQRIWKTFLKATFYDLENGRFEHKKHKNKKKKINRCGEATCIFFAPFSLQQSCNF